MSFFSSRFFSVLLLPIFFSGCAGGPLGPREAVTLGAAAGGGAIASELSHKNLLLTIAGIIGAGAAAEILQGRRPITVEEYNKIYDKAAGDTVKRLHDVMLALQKNTDPAQPQFRKRYVRVPADFEKNDLNQYPPDYFMVFEQ